MRKIYSFFIVAILTLVSMTANAINITLNIDDPSRVSVSVNYSPVEVVAGDNQFTVDEYQSVNIKAKDNAFITKVVRSMEGAEDTEEYVSNMTECNIYVSSYNAGATWTVTSVNADDSRDGSCTVTVDDPSNVELQRSGTYTYVDLTAGDNTVKFSTANELPLNIRPKNYGTALYQVKVDGEVVAPQGTQWSISPANGSKIEIFANFPDVDVPVHFTYTNEEAKGFITNVTVNGTAVTNYNDADFTVKAGSKVEISGNASDYNLVSFKINGNAQYFYSPYNFIVTDETTIEVDAHKYGTVKAMLTVDNPDNIIVYKGNSYNNDIITGLTAGDNGIELSETNAQIQVKPASGCFITSLTVNGSKYSADYEGAYTITVTEGMKIVVESGAIERNSKAMVYIDDRAAASQYFNFMRSDRSSIDIATGYNEVNFYEGDNPFGLSWHGASYANVYVNNEYLKPSYDGSTTYELNLTDGDVVKIFLASNPEMLDAEITAGESVDASKVAVVMDRITNVAEWAAKHSVLPGTEISIMPEADYGIKVTVDGTEMTAGEDGAYTIIVSKNTAIAIIAATVGISGTVADKAVAGNVYNMQGMRVADNGNTANLPAGVYIINGKKIVKR